MTLLVWRQQRTGRAARFYFSDTCHEHDWTYEQIDRLEQRHDITIERIKQDFTAAIMRRRERLPIQWRAAGVPESDIDEALSLLWPTGIAYLDLVLSKGMFAAGGARKFCTEELKIRPYDEQIAQPLLESGVSPVVWLGVRADESKKRADVTKHPRFFRSGNFQMPARILLYRPILDYTEPDVFDFHRKHNIPLNPLYAEGFKRVGCFPCINEKKAALAIIARRFPDAFDKLRRWETLIAKVAVARGTQPDKFTGDATFFPIGTVPGGGTNPIDTVAQWALTKRGGWQFDYLAGDTITLQDRGHYACTAGMGYCE